MPSKRFLYASGTKENVILLPRKRGGKLNFIQIAYSIDCVKEIAKILDIPMVIAIDRIREIKGAFECIYREARKIDKKPVKVVAYEVLTD